MFMDESDFIDAEPSAKDAEDLLHEVEELVLSESKEEPKKKSKKKKSSRSKHKGIPPPDMAPPTGAKGEDEDDFPEVDAIGSPRRGETKRESRSKEQADGLEEEQLQRHFATQRRMDMEEAAMGVSGGEIGGLGTPSSQSRARVLQQQRELQMRRRQQSMMGGMMRSTDGHHTPAMRQISAPRASADGPLYGGYRPPPNGYPNAYPTTDRRPATASSTPYGRDYGYPSEEPSLYDRSDPRFSSSRSPARPTTGDYARGAYERDFSRDYPRGLYEETGPSPFTQRDGYQRADEYLDHRPLTYDEPSYAPREKSEPPAGYSPHRRSPPRHRSPYQDRPEPRHETEAREEWDGNTSARSRNRVAKLDEDEHQGRNPRGGGGFSDGYSRRMRPEGKDAADDEEDSYGDERDERSRDRQSRRDNNQGRSAEEPEDEVEDHQAPSAIYSDPKGEGSMDSSTSPSREDGFEEGGGAVWDPSALCLEEPEKMREFLMNPAPREAGIIQCYIKRNKAGTKKMFPEYKVFMKVGDDTDMFLMTGKKRSGQKTSNYLVSMSEGDLRRTSGSYLGKLRANFVGTEFKIYDSGSNPEDEDEAGGPTRRELGVIQYESNVLGSRGPRRMQVGIPKMKEDGNAVVFQPMTSKESMLTKFKNREYRDITVCINKPPRWNDQVGAFVLNFNGRVTMASVKNFQLITHEDQDRVLLQFGRVAKDEFTMDFQWPFTPFQAFAVTLSSFDSKIACD